MADVTVRADESQATAVLYRYAYGIDLRDWSAYRAVFDAEIDVDFSSYRGRPARLLADDWVLEAQRTFDGLDATQHAMSNPLVTVEGDEADVRMYVQAAHLLRDQRGDRWFTIGGHYRDRLVRVGDSWVISAVQLNVLWMSGDESVMSDARRRAARDGGAAPASERPT